MPGVSDTRVYLLLRSFCFSVAMKVLATLAAAAAAAVFAGTASAAPRDVAPSLSSNWSGYAISDASTIAGQPTTAPLTFKSVTATWTQPKAICTAGSESYSAFWVGLGGFATSAPGLEQIGTESDCTASGKAAYFAWYELVPAPSVAIPLKIRAGDTVTTSVNVIGTDVLVQVKDRTRRTSFTKHLQMAAPDLSSAEWIAEAPSSCTGGGRCTVLPLANFGSVTFSRIAAIANDHPGTLTDATWTSLPIALVPGSSRYGSLRNALQSSTAGATPGVVSADGRAFSVAWISDATALG
jgi:hypothetical protein